MALHLSKVLDLAVASDKVCNPLLILKSKICFKTIKTTWIFLPPLFTLNKIRTCLAFSVLEGKISLVFPLYSLFDTILMPFVLLFLNCFSAALPPFCSFFQSAWNPGCTSPVSFSHTQLDFEISIPVLYLSDFLFYLVSVSVETPFTSVLS